MSGLERASVAGLPGRRGGIAGHPGGDQAVRWPHRRPRIGAIADRGRGAACCCPPSQAKRYAGMKLPVFLGSIVLSLRSEEHTSELQSLMRISYAVFCFKKKINTH